MMFSWEIVFAQKVWHEYNANTRFATTILAKMGFFNSSGYCGDFVMVNAPGNLTDITRKV